jgi:hypothetical protein
MASPELNAKISLWRQQAIDGTLSQSDLREAIAALRGDRKSAAVASEKSKTKKAAAAKPAPSADDLLDELGLL